MSELTASVGARHTSSAQLLGDQMKHIPIEPTATASAKSAVRMDDVSRAALVLSITR
jgi:hypothetical protein